MRIESNVLQASSTQANSTQQHLNKSNNNNPINRTNRVAQHPVARQQIETVSQNNNSSSCIFTCCVPHAKRRDVKTATAPSIIVTPPTPQPEAKTDKSLKENKADLRLWSEHFERSYGWD